MTKSFTLLSLVSFALLAIFALPTNADAQKRNSKPSASSTAKAKNGKDSKAKKDAKSARASDKKTDKKSSRKEDLKKQTASKRDDKRAKSDKKNSKSDERSAKNSKNDKNSKRQTAAEKRAEAERRRREEAERRAAIEAERRRRAEIERRRREAIARARAFENGLRTETQANIATDDTRGEDLAVRQAAISALGNRAGTVVVMDAQNGQILTAVNQKWAFGQGYKPCSTIKLVTGIAGKNEKVINDFGNVSTKPSRLDLTDALAVSNNGYFQNVGGEIGFEKMTQYARELGLGTQTGVNAPNESHGKLPAPKTGWSVNRMSSHGDDFEVTPLQLATMVSAITNGGKLLQPQIARTPQEADKLRPKVRRSLNLSNNTLQTVVPGMMGAVNYGTARRANDPTLNIGGKTGSCIGQGSWLGLFASVAPVANPKYAVVVVTRGQAERGKWASAVAGQVYQALAPRLRALQPLLANTPAPTAPRPKIDVNDTALSDEGADDEAAESAGLNPDIPQPDDKKSLVKKTAEVKPNEQPNRTTATNPGIIVVPVSPAPSATPKVTPTVKVRPRIVPQ